ncbi:MAG: LysR family transcriptional regulator [Sulfitobacter sp.]
MIRSFTALASTLNLSHAVRELGSTRQTVRRHIANLEEAKGTALFTVEDRQYRLTEAGEQALPEAQDILARANIWLRGLSSHVGGLQTLKHTELDDWSFYQQQHSLSTIWTSESPLMRETFRAWAMSGGDIESEELAHVRPFLVVYRQSAVGWLCVEFGEKSFYVNWFGLAKARSSIGKPIGSMPGGEDFARMLNQPFHEVMVTQGARVDHVHTQVPRADTGDLEPVNYQRLLLGGRFPDGSPALFTIVEPTEEVDIHGLEQTVAVPLREEVKVKFDPSTAKYERS